MTHRLLELHLSPEDTWCDTSRHGLQDSGSKHLLQWASTRSGTGSGGGAISAWAGCPLESSPGSSWEPHRAQTDSKVSTHGQLTDTVALSPPHPGLTSHVTPARGLSAQWVPGAAGTEEWAAFLLAFPSIRLCQTLELWAEGATLSHPALRSSGSTHGLPLDMQHVACSFQRGALKGPWAPAQPVGPRSCLPEPQSRPSPLWPIRNQRLHTFYSGQLLRGCSCWAL